MTEKKAKKPVKQAGSKKAAPEKGASKSAAPRKAGSAKSGKSKAEKVAAKKAASPPSSFETTASVRGVRISPRKARIVVEMIKGKQVEPALQILKASGKKAGAFTAKLLESAIANAAERASADVDNLWVKNAYVDMGKTMKRYMPRAQGRATPIRKRSAHITVVLKESA